MSKPVIALNTMVVTSCFEEEPLEAILHKLSALGISGVEISQHIPFDPARDLAVLARPGMPAVCGLSVQMDGPVANPVPPMTFRGKPIETFAARQDFQRVVGLCREMHCPYVRFAGLPGAALTCKDTLLAYLQDLEDLARQYRQAGLGLCLHNHTEEFIRVEGRWLLDWILEKAPHVQLELDLLNAQKAGVSPVELLGRCAGRVPLVHLQDMGVFPSPTGEWMKSETRNLPLGQGNLPLDAIWQQACQAGVEYLVIEQWPLYGQDPYGQIAFSVKALQGLAPCT